MTQALSVRWLLHAADLVAAERDRLTQLDAAIGDGDHGINLDRGFREITRLLRGVSAESLSDGDALELAGGTILGTVGGASGALYGRAFARAGAALSATRLSVPEPSPSAVPDSQPSTAAFSRAGATARPIDLALAALDAAVTSMRQLGRSGPGDKTMLDALVPALEALRTTEPGTPFAVALRSAAQAADDGAAATIPLVARRGRASYLGERSAGHLDPGAASSALLLRALADVAAS